MIQTGWALIRLHVDGFGQFRTPSSIQHAKMLYAATWKAAIFVFSAVRAVRWRKEMSIQRFSARLKMLRCYNSGWGILKNIWEHPDMWTVFAKKHKTLPKMNSRQQKYHWLQHRSNYYFHVSPGKVCLDPCLVSSCVFMCTRHPRWSRAINFLWCAPCQSMRQTEKPWAKVAIHLFLSRSLPPLVFNFSKMSSWCL